MTHRMTTRRKRRSAFRRWWDRFLRAWRYFSDIHYANRSDGAKRAAQTRRARRGESMAVKVDPTSSLNIPPAIERAP